MYKYPIVEHFYTLQGEGFYSGQAAYFIRLAGCDVGCVWCDTKESWDESKHSSFNLTEIVNWVKTANANLVVITGGEPLMHSLDALTYEFDKINVRLNIETSGSHLFSGKWNWVCLSPKKFKLPLPENYKYANELKIVVSNKHDLTWALEQAKNVNKSCMLYLQPEWNKQNELLPMMIEFIKQHPQWKLSLQTHKMIGIE